MELDDESRAASYTVEGTIVNGELSKIKLTAPRCLADNCNYHSSENKPGCQPGSHERVPVTESTAPAGAVCR
jgi:hypothetical protein